MAYLSLRYSILDDIELIHIARCISKLLWNYEKNIQSSDKSPYQEIWTHIDSDGNKQVLIYIYDHMLDIKYIEFRGFDKESLINDINSVRSELNLYDMNEVWGMISSSSDIVYIEKMTKILFAIAPDDYDPDSYSLLVEQLRFPNEQVQLAAIFACTYVGWRELRLPLEELSLNPDPVGEEARNVLSALERHNWSK